MCSAPILVAVLCATASAARVPDSEWPLIGRDAEQHHYAALNAINDKNVDRLGLLWSAEIPTRDGLVGVPLVMDGVVYQSGAMSRIYANDVRTGKSLWTFDPQVRPRAGQIVSYWGGRVNRGLALWEDRVIVGTGDCRLVAIDRHKGTKIWDVQACDSSLGYTITGAPRVGGGKIFIGNANADTGANRGYADAYDGRTGKLLWRFYTVPGDPAKGFESEALANAAKTWGKDYWKRSGGGSVWDAITFDSKLNQVYIGTDGASPASPEDRGAGAGDELYTTSIIALDAESGKYLWHFQTTPHDGWNYDATMHIMVSELAINGSRHRVVMEAPKNGFFYVLDARSGKLLTVNNFVPVTWASSVDLATGRPRVRPEAEWWHRSSPTEIVPSVLGAHGWQPMSFSELTHLVYIPTSEQPMTLTRGTGTEAVGGADASLYIARGSSQFKGGLVAYDPVKAQVVWRHDVGFPQNGGVLSTAGNLVFQGTSDGFFRAYEASGGRPLWQFQADGGFYAAPITIQVDGRQVVLIPSGSGTASSVFTYSRMGGMTRGPSRLLAFALDGQAHLPPAAPHSPLMSKPLLPRPDPAIAEKGKDAYYSSGCELCHGFDAIGPEGGSIPDLRKSQAFASDQLAAIVIGGMRAEKGMPSFAGKVTPEQLNQIRAYVAEQAWNAYSQKNAP